MSAYWIQVGEDNGAAAMVVLRNESIQALGLPAAIVSADAIAARQPPWGGGDLIEVFDAKGILLASRHFGGAWDT